MKMFASLMLAVILGIMLSVFGLFAAKEQGPPGLGFDPVNIAYTVLALGLAFVVARNVIAGVAGGLASTLFRLRRSPALRALLKHLMAFIRIFGAAAVRLVPQSHFQMSRGRSFAT